MNGLIVVNKKTDMTSRDVVNILCKKFNTKSIGHTGTLDPIATGVLVCLIGRYTKLVNIITAHEKEYIATLKLGILTDTLDITGNIIDTKKYDEDLNKINEVLKSFIGKYMQEVPSYSAIIVNGKRLYKYAKENIKVELPKREVEIYNIKLLEYNQDIIKFKVKVSSGTYIRSLIRDIGQKLNTYATMTNLIRTKVGNYDINTSYTIDDIKNDNYDLLTYKDIFKDYKIYELNDNEYFKVKNGQKIKLDINDKEVVFTYKNEYIALYEKEDNIYKIKIMLQLGGN